MRLSEKGDLAMTTIQTFQTGRIRTRLVDLYYQVDCRNRGAMLNLLLWWAVGVGGVFAFVAYIFMTYNKDECDPKDCVRVACNHHSSK